MNKAGASLVAVRKDFGPVTAIESLNLDIAHGKITVLLGPNGAGKTTVVRLITGAYPADAGTVEVFGVDPQVEGEMIRRRTGVVSAKPALYDRATGRENLAYAAELYGLNPSTAPIDESAARFGIHDALDLQVGGYSTGMKTRLALSRAVLHSPDLLLLDEPTSGLDPESSHEVLELIREMTDAGQTVMMCTHLLLEAEGLADRVVVMDHGHAVVDGQPAELINRYWPKATVKLEAEDPETLHCAASYPGVTTYQAQDVGGTAVIQIDDIAKLPDLVQHLVAGGARLSRVEPYRPSLEDLYFAVRGSNRARGVESPMDAPPPDASTAAPIPAPVSSEVGA